mmetsp:Transcript_12982/g.35345  ORF Transcript_12982/g.35345 Transcript_12982/m.35345 type:complete len:88 (+) Transcript_12982:362-625(+)
MRCEHCQNHQHVCIKLWGWSMWCYTLGKQSSFVFQKRFHGCTGFCHCSAKVACRSDLRTGLLRASTLYWQIRPRSHFLSTTQGELRT